MKTYLFTTLAALATALSLAAHEGTTIGPNGGRIVELDKRQDIDAEVTLTNGQFQVTILDKDRKPVALKDQSLTVIAGDRKAPEKPAVEKQADRFVFAAPKGDDYPVVFQFKQASDSKAATSRFQYDATICTACKNPEWLCTCGEEQEKKDGKNEGHDKHADHKKK